MAKRYQLSILLFEGVEELDFVGPWEVFTVAAQNGAPLDPFTVGWPGAEIRCAKGLRVTADYPFADAPRADIVLIPGGKGTRPLANDPAFIAALRPYVAAARLQTSVCTGAALLGRLGFLEQRRATTNRGAFDFFQENAPAALLIEDARFVHDDNIVTAAGVSAGIDMSLWLVGHLFGQDLARTTQRQMEYFPEPPYGTAPA